MSKKQNNKVWVSGAIKKEETKPISKSQSIILWFVVAIIVGAGVFVNSYFSSFTSSYTASIVVVIVILAMSVARFTNQGRRFWSFFQDSKLELSKVVWPSRKETMTITIMVILVVLIFSVLIYFVGLLFGHMFEMFLR